jgi:AraC-like DNA-binding protein
VIDNKTSSRQAEESRIVATWLARLRDLLSEENVGRFEKALQNAGIDPSLLSNGTDQLTQGQLDSVLLECRQWHPDITLRLFSKAEILDLGLVGYAAINSDSVGSAFRVMYQYHSLASDRYTDELLVEGDTVRIVPVHHPLYEDDYQNICEDSFSGNWRALQLLLGPHADTGKISVKFEFRAPLHAETYFKIFGPNCLFEAEETGLIFPAEWLQRSIHRGSGSLSDVYKAMCERVLGPSTIDKDTPSQVRRLLLSRKGRQMPRLEDAAELLRLTPAQLRKRLYRADTSYKKLVLETRMELGKHYLQDTNLSIQEIAYLLDYGSPPPFSRAFKKYVGRSPEDFRMLPSTTLNGPKVSTKGIKISF